MAALTGNTISSTYQSLIKIADNSSAGAGLENLTDGLGNATALSLGTGDVSVRGTFGVSGSTVFSGSTWFTGSTRFGLGGLTGSLFGTASVAVAAVNASTASYITQAVSASFSTTASNVTALFQPVQITGSVTVSGSVALNASGSFVLPLSASASPVVGAAYFNAALSKLYVYNGSSWLSASLA